MNKQRGYSLMELAIVLVVIGLLLGGITAGFSHYRDRAEYIGAGRNHELADLIDELKAVHELPAQGGDGPGTPEEGGGDGPASEGESGGGDGAGTPEPEAGDGGSGPFWKRWLDWWRNTGRHDNRRSTR